MIQRIREFIDSVPEPGYSSRQSRDPNPSPKPEYRPSKEEEVNEPGPSKNRRFRRRSPRYPDYPGDGPVYDHGGEPGEGAFEIPNTGVARGVDGSPVIQAEAGSAGS